MAACLDYAGGGLIPHSDAFDPSRGVEAELARLRAQALAVWPRELLLLRSFGLSDGMRVLDVGCGPGTVTRMLALEWPHAEVVGLDPDPERVQLAERQVADLPRVSIEQGTLADSRLAPADFDFAYARFVLQHMRDPARELDAARTLLRPGARLLVVDADDGLFAIHPQPPELAELVRLSEAVQTARGGDRRIGRKLGHLLQQAGFEHVVLEGLTLTNTDLGHEKLADLCMGFRMRRVRDRLGDRSATLIDAVQGFLDGKQWYGMVCLLAASGTSP